MQRIKNLANFNVANRKIKIVALKARYTVLSPGIQHLVFYLIILCYKYSIVLLITKIHFMIMCIANHERKVKSKY